MVVLVLVVVVLVLVVVVLVLVVVVFLMVVFILVVVFRHGQVVGTRFAMNLFAVLGMFGQKMNVRGAWAVQVPAQLVNEERIKVKR